MRTQTQRKQQDKRREALHSALTYIELIAATRLVRLVLCIFCLR